MKYRKKQLVIEAFKWTGDAYQSEDPVWMVEAVLDKVITYDIDENGAYVLMVNTLTGVAVATNGDYIIRGIQGELYPCKPDIFEATYELIEERVFNLIVSEVTAQYSNCLVSVIASTLDEAKEIAQDMYDHNRLNLIADDSSVENMIEEAE